VTEEGDLYGPFEQSQGFEFLQSFLSEPPGPGDAAEIESEIVQADLSECFERSFKLGSLLGRRGDSTAFKAWLARLGQERGVASWVALVGLCHGLFFQEYREADAEFAFALLRNLLPS
jgi:hypothetical protein